MMTVYIGNICSSGVGVLKLTARSTVTIFIIASSSFGPDLAAPGCHSNISQIVLYFTAIMRGFMDVRGYLIRR